MIIYLMIGFLIGVVALFCFLYIKWLESRLEETIKQLDNSNRKNEQLKQEINNAQIRKNIEENNRLQSDNDVDQLLEQGGYLRNNK
ncbi:MULTISPECIES: DUF2681 domain-containing protein [Pasteurellaceae]|uniref:DUF2681 domain-containing protein n=1 Tax=Pasteurella atlantica TaxID=2827233 RepID=A0AAW8CLQ9_9PAST|nr:DUF2681 domain-containing protein [Pasteurella atlantica]MBR0573697.1 DUF2681 domain-containing protein [Pasteurella atlantica]MDP8039668.1 DUF2681 domain-containing protein [Pasteurella atlantica]MDP8041759.1 DUF2681 domain-containing protein [Pasteurella atlantica]MDP8043967.1 DUF2681 domain-containing protein [Pasteurella atlantica]MDP8045945.1 DUF2681 domain-containing protein [Pasteurella atlantica]